MASIGCGLLVGGLLLMVLGAVVLKIAKLKGLDRLAAAIGKLPLLLLALLVLFLLVQLLQRVIPAKKEHD